MRDLEPFRQETRAWLEQNCPESMRTPVKGFGDYNYHLDRFPQLSGF